MLNKLFNKKEVDPQKEKERVKWSTLISGTLFLLGMILLLLLSVFKK